MKKMENFRDQLNKQLFDDANDDDNFESILAKGISEKKEFKIPPKLFKRPEVKQETVPEQIISNDNEENTTQSINTNNAIDTNTINNYTDANNTVNTEKDENQICNNNYGEENIYNINNNNNNFNDFNYNPITSNLVFTNPETNIEHTSPKSEEIQNNTKKSSPQNQENNSFFEDNCHSVTLSENKDLKNENLETDLYQDKKHNDYHFSEEQPK
jgi:hypothetical protein